MTFQPAVPVLVPIADVPGAPVEFTGAIPKNPRELCLTAFRHGLTQQVFVLSADEAGPYRKLHAEILDYYQPAGPIEKSLADQIANGIWRLQRAAAMEEAIFAMDHTAHIDPGTDSLAEGHVAGPAHTFLTAGKSVDMLLRYEGRIRRGLEKDKAELRNLQAERKQAAAQAMNQAVALHDLAKKENKPYQPELYFKASPETFAAVFQTELVSAESARREAWAATQARLQEKAPKSSK